VNFLAQLPDVPWNTTGGWMLGLIGVLGATSLVFAVAIQAKKLFGKEPPISEELRRLGEACAARYAQSEASLQSHAVADDKIHAELFGRVNAAERGVEDRLSARLDKIERDSIESRRPMHRDIDAIRADVAGVKATLAANSEQLKALSQQQSDMPAQIVSLLNNTGAIQHKK
jgi:hypothetical protein